VSSLPQSEKDHPSHVSTALRHRGSGRPGWLIAAVAVIGALLVVVLGLLAFRLAGTFAGKHSAEGVAVTEDRSGKAPAAEPQLRPTSRQRPPESWLPALPTPLPDGGGAGAVRLGTPERAAMLAFPPGRFVIEESGSPPLKRMANHLFVDTQPRGAQVWIDGAWKGKTPLDVSVGAGGKRLVLIAAGYQMIHDTFDASEGSIVRVALVPVAGPERGDAFLNLTCQTPGKFPIFIDDVATGLLCPASDVPVTAGVHRVGVFVPAERSLVTVETTVAAGPKPVEVALDR